ncbi:(2Fe-2S)-binding protein [Aquamicrobium sp. LC103]|uniref:(2Fe-2S)-binding protein n=1 Tax=Aquamicrobium sp. LC103 TaxID=1120658 RepID=UPI00063EA9BE|nr:(2Fe-2S)-binding protein [Aquamicrobium sp. LC103]TKT78152.1 (2Fe-2S)-binding protein [Aquamicrobium sp. LC103]
MKITPEIIFDGASERLAIADGEAGLRAALKLQEKVSSQTMADIGALAPGWTRADLLFGDDAALEDMLDYQAGFADEMDLKTRAAYHITEYSNRFALVAVAPFVGFGLVPDFRPASVALSHDTRPLQLKTRLVDERLTRLRFLSERAATSDALVAQGAAAAEARALLRDLLRQGVEAHFEPLISGLHRKTSLSESAMWRLVGDSLGARFLDAGQYFDRLEEAKSDALAILKHRGSPLNNRQLHYFEVTVRDDADPDRVLARRTFRARGGCCRFYTVEGGHLCSTCVLQKPADRDRIVEAGMRRHLGLAPRPEDAVVNGDAPG